MVTVLASRRAEDKSAEAIVTGLRGAGLDVLHIPLTDEANAPVSDHFVAAFQYIQEAIAAKKKNGGGKVLVHCSAGVSRSATIVLSYLLQSRPEWTLRDAFLHVRKKRPCVMPNVGLCEAAARVRGE